MKVLLLAGEESGEIYARGIARALRAADSVVEIRGYGDYGFSTGDLAVFGILHVLLRFRFLLRVKRTLERAIDTWRPDVVVTVDYPGMHLRLGAYAKARGIRAVHVVCPQVWAWKRGRIPRIEASFDRLCCFFPFEPALFRPGFATFVGHPLVEDFAAEAAAVPATHGAGRLLAVLPGSRLGEIAKILPTLLAVIARLRGRHADLGVVIPAANDRAEAAIRRQLSVAGTPSVEVRRGGARALLRSADLAVVASGTATLEAALARCPTVLVYKVDALLAFVCRRVIRGVRHIGLANIIAEKAGTPCPMPELLQEAMTVEAVEAQLERWLTDEGARQAAVARLDETMALLKSDGAAFLRIARLVRDGGS